MVAEQHCGSCDARHLNSGIGSGSSGTVEPNVMGAGGGSCAVATTRMVLLLKQH